MGVVCLPCLDELGVAAGVDVAATLKSVQFTGKGKTVILYPAKVIYYGDIEGAYGIVMAEQCAPDEKHCTCVPHLRRRIAELTTALEQCKRPHYYCDDPWYSCPLDPEGCANNQIPQDKCRCGADEFNARIDKVIAEARKA